MSDPPREHRLSTNWAYEEIVLACDLVVANDWQALDRRSDSRVSELSELLRRMSPQRAAADPTFRNVDGVGRKTHDLATARPGFAGVRTKGGRVTGEVAAAFHAEPTRMHELAIAIQAAALDADHLDTRPPDLDEDDTVHEGQPFERRHLARERDPKALREKIRQCRRSLTRVQCEACGFDFEAAYGIVGRNYIECHHRNPCNASGSAATALGDLALLCSNCHRIIHRHRPWMTVEQLSEIVAAQRSYGRGSFSTPALREQDG